MLLAAALVATGCQTTALSESARAPRGDDLVSLLRYGTGVRALDATELEQQYRELIAQKGADGSPATDLRLSLLLSNPTLPSHSVNQATRLLADVIASPLAAPESTELARLMYHLLNERNCVESNAGVLASMLIEERERSRALGEQLGEARSALAAERRQRETLQQQLDALRRLEQQINEDRVEE